MAEMGGSDELTVEERSAYWEAYYKRSAHSQVPLPSQFAVFVQGELTDPAFVVDIGCGAGRDSLFFASRGNEVVGVDRADAAIENCRSIAKASGLEVSFMQSSVDADDLAARVSEHRKAKWPTVVYARFFLHAIVEEAERRFLETAAKLCAGGGLLAVEFRTVRDQSLSKVTPDHYRRFIEPAEFLSRAYKAGFASEYYVEGFGFAKYKQDDAYVVRCLLRGA